MAYYIHKNLKKELSNNKYGNIINRMHSFVEELDRNKSRINETRKSFWVRSVKGTSIYKFRLNNGDRMLFTYFDYFNGREKHKDSILFLDYCTHDEQIRRAHRLPKLIKKDIDTYEPFTINRNDYSEDEIGFDNQEAAKFKYATQDYGTINREALPFLYIEDDEQLKKIVNLPDEDLVYCLNSEQANCLQCHTPSILTGSAGTGKTMVAIQKLLLGEQNGKKGLYVSYTERLVKDTKRIFDANSEQRDIITFSNVNNLFRHYLGYTKKNEVVELYLFSEWLQGVCTVSQKRKFEPYEIWSEIRGFIKGHICNEKDIQTELCKNIIPPKTYIDEIGLQGRKKEHFRRSDREALYAIACEYDQWCSKNHFLDENNLARDFLRRDLSVIELYDIVVIDEVQDLSEFQIYALMRLCKDKCNLLISGDIRQKIHPSFFDFHQIHGMLYAENGEVSWHSFHLRKNYRCQKHIVDISNKLIELNKRIRALKEPYSVYEEPIFDGMVPTIIDDTTMMANHLLEKALNSPNVVFLVTNSAQKKEAEKKFRKLLSEKYNAAGLILTIAEAKGLEFSHVICFNIVGYYSEALRSLCEDYVKDNNYLQYVLNLLYVAISRAKDTLLFYDQDSNHSFFRYIFGCDHIDGIQESLSRVRQEHIINDTAIENLANEIDQEDKSEERWRSRAEKLFDSGLYAEALKQYEQINDKEGILACEAKVSRDIDWSEVHKKEKCLQSILSYDIQIRQGSVGYAIRRGHEYYKNGKELQALKYFLYAVSQEPDNSRLYYDIANCYTYLWTSNYLALFGHVSLCYELAVLYYKHCLYLKPADIEVSLQLATVLDKLDNYDEALEQLEKAKRFEPDNPTILYMMSHDYLRTRQIRKAKEYLSKGKSQVKNNPSYIFDKKLREWNVLLPKNQRNNMNKMMDELLS